MKRFLQRVLEVLKSLRHKQLHGSGPEPPPPLFFIFGQLQVKHVENKSVTFSKAAGQRESNRDLLLTHRHACQHRKLLQFARPSNFTTDKLCTQPSLRFGLPLLTFPALCTFHSQLQLHHQTYHSNQWGVEMCAALCMCDMKTYRFTGVSL